MTSRSSAFGRRKTRGTYVPPAARSHIRQEQKRVSSENPFFDFKKLIVEAAESTKWNRIADIVDLSVQCARQWQTNDPTFEDEWKALITTVIDVALSNGSHAVELAVQIFNDLVVYPQFQLYVYDLLLQCTAVTVDDDCLLSEAADEYQPISSSRLPIVPKEIGERTSVDERAKNLCHLLSQFLIHQWRPPHNVVRRNSNAVLAATHVILSTWLKELHTYNTDEITTKLHPDNDYTNIKLSAICLCIVSKKAGRRLWLNYPDLVDNIWLTLQQTILTSNEHVDRSIKMRMLNTWQTVNEWTLKGDAIARANAQLFKKDKMTQTGCDENELAIKLQNSIIE